MKRALVHFLGKAQAGSRKHSRKHFKLLGAFDTLHARFTNPSGSNFFFLFLGNENECRFFNQAELLL
jgi:hypothetical protein